MECGWSDGEREAGSDLVALRTLAQRVDGHYVVNDSKIWTSYADHADFCFLRVRTDAASCSR